MDARYTSILYRKHLWIRSFTKSLILNKCLEDINTLIIASLKSVQSSMVQHKHCFELYGYDVLLDETCKPWLIEINASPSLTTNSKADKILKKDLISSVLNIVFPQENIEYCYFFYFFYLIIFLLFKSENILKMGTNWC